MPALDWPWLNLRNARHIGRQAVIPVLWWPTAYDQREARWCTDVQIASWLVYKLRLAEGRAIWKVTATGYLKYHSVQPYVPTRE
jgi:hypothetical protein